MHTSKGYWCIPTRCRTDDLPAEFRDLHALLVALVSQAQVDGLFTDHPDLIRQFIDQPMAHAADHVPEQK